LLIFPNFNKVFEIYTDASDYQFGSVIARTKNLLRSIVKKLTATQRNYIVGEREMLSIVETLNEFRTVLLGHKLIIYTEHKNLINLKTVSKSP
jgi:hypothetical protein